MGRGPSGRCWAPAWFRDVPAGLLRTGVKEPMFGMFRRLVPEGCGYVLPSHAEHRITLDAARSCR
jgi:hypothetical protein